MSDGEGGGYSLWTVIKAVLITLGAIYLMSVISWFAQWAVVLLAVGGIGYLGYRVASALAPGRKELPAPRTAPPKMLASETPFDQRMRQLEDEERVLDRKLGL